MKIEKDKILHALGSGTIAIAVSFILSRIGFGPLSILFGAMVALVVGLLKEIYDSKTGGVNDPGDVKADIIGIIIGAVISGAVII